MIERKDIKHVYTSDVSNYNDRITSGLLLTIECAIDRKLQQTANFDMVEHFKHDNEEAIRQKLYGDVVDELRKITREPNGRWPDECVIMDMCKMVESLIAKLEWRE